MFGVSEKSQAKILQNNGEVKTAEAYNGNVSNSLKTGENEGRDANIDKYAINLVPITRVKMKNLPPYNESQSDANEWATRWAHRDEVETGAQTLVFYHGICYVIGKYDSVDLKYQIEGRIKYSDYLAIRKELEEDARNRKKHPTKKTADIISKRNKRRNSDEGRRQSIDNSSDKHRGKDREVLRLDRKQDREQETQNNTSRSDEYDSKDRQTKSVKEDKSDVAFIEKEKEESSSTSRDEGLSGSKSFSLKSSAGKTLIKQQDNEINTNQTLEIEPSSEDRSAFSDGETKVSYSLKGSRLTASVLSDISNILGDMQAGKKNAA